MRIKLKGLLIAALVAMIFPLATANAAKPRIIQGAGTTMVAGGTGSPNYIPVITMLGIQWNGTTGTLDCLALAPSHAAGSSGSGSFDDNIMYVTAVIETVSFSGDTVTMTGTANCTGLGAGNGVPFTAVAQRGGPGARMTLKVSGLTFVETLIAGNISF
jgi:hypothetical protein